jgi:glycerophosphoryl diester phosphodiesterase
VGGADPSRPVVGHPGKAAWHHRLGELRERRDDWVGAAESFDLAAQLDPRSTRFVRLGVARSRCWDYPGALDAFAAAVGMDDSSEELAPRLERIIHAMAALRPFAGRVVAHRGSLQGRAENARESLDHLPVAVAGVEVDVRLSRDGVVVLMHDADVRRTTDGSGQVEELSYADVSALTGRDGTCVPTLEEYLDACAGRDLEPILVDVKAPTLPTLRAVAAVIRGSPVANACVIMVRAPEQMRDVRDVDAAVRLGRFGVHVDGVVDQVALALQYRAEVMMVVHGDRSYLRHRSAVGVIQDSGLAAGASVVNSRRALEAVRKDGCDLLVTDRSDQLTHFMGVDRQK